MKKITFKEWYESEGFEEIIIGGSQMVNSEYLIYAFNANAEYIAFLEKLLDTESNSEYLYRKDKL